MRFIITLIVFLFVPVSGNSAVIVVPDDYATIQAAIDHSVNGDTIVVKPGAYVENIDFNGKAITLESEGGAAVTIIDGNQSGSVVRFHSGENIDSILDGFSLINGNGTKLPPYTTWSGGGICCSGNSSPMIRNNIIAGNSATNGGGIYAEFSSPCISHNTISQNTTAGEGAAILCHHTSNLVIENNTVSENSAQSWGGGIELAFVTSITVSNNIVSQNESVNQGSGGILFARDCTGIITNNVVYGNTVNRYGSGIDIFYNSHATIENNTVFENSANHGGGIACRENSSVTVTNTILWNNTANFGPEIYLNVSSSASIDYSDLQGGQSSVYQETGTTLSWGSDMIDADPLFVDAAGDDFHLTYNSPCRNTGDNGSVTESFDFEGDPRIAWTGTVDMGADEFYTHLYCTGDLTPGGSVEGKLVGMPGTAPVGLFIGTDVRDPALPTAFGDFYLQAPWMLVPLIPIPADGILVLPTTVPIAPPAHYDVPAQAIIGLSSDSLTNLYVIEIR